MSPAFQTATLVAPPAAAGRSIWAGRALSALAVLFLAVDAAIKVVAPEQAIAAMEPLGWPAHHLPTLALLQAVCLVLYLAPRTAPLGAVLWTGYLGGAVASHLRLDNPLASHTLFPVYVAALLWAGLALRDARVRALLLPSR